MKQLYLFLLSISPVQSFISQARKTQDLFAGSQLLSYLCQVGIEAFSRQAAFVEIIYPESHNPSLPNRFVGKLEANAEELQTIGKEVSDEVHAAWQDRAMDCLQRFKLLPHLPAGFDEQINKHLTIFWTCVPIQAGEYLQAYSKLEQSMGAMKNYRHFEQFEYQHREGKLQLGEAGRKCSLDGSRNVQFYKLTDRELVNGLAGDSGNITAAYVQVANTKLFVQDHREICFINPQHKLVGPAILRPGEGLSAVSFTKRAFRHPQKGKNLPFPSTAKVCLLPFHQLWAHEAVFQKAYQKMKSQIASLATDGEDDQLYYEENLSLHYFNKHGLFPPDIYDHKEVPEQEELELVSETEEVRKRMYQKLREVQKVQAQLANTTKSYFKSKQAGGFEMPKYYAVLAFDGDSMGNWLAGKYLTDPEGPGVLEAFHKCLSQAQGNFAQHVATYLRRSPKGEAVYTGGDDFLGLINLEYLLEVLEEIRKDFDHMVAQALLDHEGFEIVGNKRISLTAAAVIAHYKTPLSTVIGQARKLEKEAKSYRAMVTGNKKDVLGISVMKKSGELIKTFLDWKRQGASTWMTQSLSQVTARLRRHYSNSFIHALHQEFLPMFENGESPVSLLEEFGPEGDQTIPKPKRGMVGTEVHRQLKRSRMNSPADPPSNENSTPSQAGESMYDDCIEILGAPKELPNGLKALLICDFIQRNTKGTFN